MQPDFTVLPLEARHVADVARLHLQHLQTPFRGASGAALLRCYYNALIRADGACGYVIEAGGHVQGYVCGVWKPGTIKRILLRRYPIKLAVWALAQIAANPPILPQLLRRLPTRSTQSSQSETVLDEGYELRPIVVSIEYRGTPVARLLVERLLRDADNRKFETLFLYTEVDNSAANRFYTKLGFKITDSNQREQTLYNRYEISVGKHR